MPGKSQACGTGRPDERARPLSRVRPWQAALVAGVALLCYAQTAGYGFVWDDNQQIGANDRIRSFARLKEAFAEPFWAFYEPKLRGHYYRPLQTLAYTIVYAAGGLDPAVYHGLNIVLHALASLALVWMRNPVWRDEKTLYTATLAVSPGAAMMHQNLGALYYREGKLAEALAEFEAARAASESAFVRSARETRDALVGIATAQMALGRLEDAWRAAAEAQRLDPECRQAWFILGSVRTRQGRDAEAEPLLEKAVSLAPSDAAARVNLGSVLLFRDKRDRAEEQFRAALALEPGSVPARLGLAMCRAGAGDRQEALRIVREILREQPDNADARRLLDQIQGSAARAPRLP